MKFSYDKEVNILMVKLSNEPYEYASERNGIIFHFTKHGKPVLLEVQGGSEFILGALQSLVKSGTEVTV
ncbi:MAG: DUF2283 domain-containing protein [SAR202 cluster bacterium]|nr:DUF2283 domain-containing protein [SAR202 cluster bacterium]